MKLKTSSTRFIKSFTEIALTLKNSHNYMEFTVLDNLFDNSLANECILEFFRSDTSIQLTGRLYPVISERRVYAKRRKRFMHRRFLFNSVNKTTLLHTLVEGPLPTVINW